MDRRSFLKSGSLGLAGICLTPSILTCASPSVQHEMFFKISLAQWSLHRTIRSGKLTNLDFPLHAKTKYDIHAVEYVNQFFLDKAKDLTYLNNLKQRTDDNNIENVLIMIDAEGDLGEAEKSKRKQSVENHFKWVEAAKTLGCHSIRVNAKGHGTIADTQLATIESLSELSTFAADYGINIIVENHGSYSSNGKWLNTVMKKVNLKNCGTLPDFGNFYEYDRYVGVEEMLPFAKGVSAKTNDFKSDGEEIEIDYLKMLSMVKMSGYTGHIGIEFEGNNTSEEEGIIKTRDLLLKYGKQLGV